MRNYKKNMMKKRILVDMDGVLANVYISFINKQYTEKGIKKEYTDLIGLKECGNTSLFLICPLRDTVLPSLL